MSTRVTLVADGARAEALAPLVRAWGREGTVCLVDGARLPPEGALRELAGDADALLLVGDRRWSPRTVLPGPVLRAADGRAVPAAWLPDTGAAALDRFARAAARVHDRRAEGLPTVVLLSQRHRRFGDLAERTSRVLATEGAGRVHCHLMTAYDAHRDDVAHSLGTGPAMSVYLGHGRPIGWVGYAGLRSRHWGQSLDPQWRPGGAVLSLTCRTASRRRTGLSFAESIPLDGVAAAAVGAVGPTLHSANARWALRISRAVADCRTIGELLAEVAPHDPEAAAYRLLGDPTAPLRDDPAWVAAHQPLEV